jgi:hypothetical protein
MSCARDKVRVIQRGAVISLAALVELVGLERMMEALRAAR